MENDKYQKLEMLLTERRRLLIRIDEIESEINPANGNPSAMYGDQDLFIKDKIELLLCSTYKEEKFSPEKLAEITGGKIRSIQQYLYKLRKAQKIASDKNGLWFGL